MLTDIKESIEEKDADVKAGPMVVLNFDRMQLFRLSLHQEHASSLPQCWESADDRRLVL